MYYKFFDGSLKWQNIKPRNVFVRWNCYINYVFLSFIILKIYRKTVHRKTIVNNYRNKTQMNSKDHLSLTKTSKFTKLFFLILLKLASIVRLWTIS